MEFAIVAMIFAGATTKILNKIGSHLVSIYLIILAQNIGGALVALAALVLLPHASLSIPPSHYTALGINVLLWPIAGVLTFYGIRHTQISIRESLTQSRLIFVPLIAVVFLGENISVSAALGTLLVFVGILVAIYKRELSFAHPDLHGFWYVLAASFLIAITSTLDKYNVTVIDYLYYAFLIYAAQTLTFLLFLTKERRRELLALAKDRNAPIVFCAALGGGIFYILQLWLYQHLALHIAYPFIQLASASALLLAIVFLNERDRIPFKILGFCIAAAGALVLRLAV